MALSGIETSIIEQSFNRQSNLPQNTCQARLTDNRLDVLNTMLSSKHGSNVIALSIANFDGQYWHYRFY